MPVVEMICLAFTIVAVPSAIVTIGCIALSFDDTPSEPSTLARLRARLRAR